MPRRSPPADAALGALRLALLLTTVVGAPLTARAETSGAVDARALIGVDQRYGGAVLADVWAGRGRLRIGGAFGLGALSAHGEKSSRVVSPVALSLALAPRDERGGFVGVLRLGGYGGGEQGGFIAGGFGSCAVGYAVSLGEGASFRMTADVWGLLGPRGGVFLGPALGLGF